MALSIEYSEGQLITDTGVVIPTGIGELGYAENLNDVTTTTVLDPIPGCAITVPVGLRPIKLIAESYLFNDAAGGITGIEIWENNTSGTRYAIGVWKSIGINDAQRVHCERRLAPTVGPHTYILALRRTTSGTAHAYGASDFGATSLQAIQL